MTESPFHAGERAVQSRVGVRDKIEPIGRRLLRDAMPDQHRALFEELPMLLVGSVDRGGGVWASVLVGRPGFVRSPDPRHLEIRGGPIAGDPAAGHLRRIGAPVGVLGIQLETRRRNRMNGRISEVARDGFTVAVEQSFGNCPQYIQARAPYLAEPQAPPSPFEEGPQLSAAAVALIRRADTFFIATASADPGGGGDASEGVDVSHRGGRPGFVGVSDGTVLDWPDFRGNFMFNTLGNLEVNPRAGVVFVDFVSGDLLSLTGEARVQWDPERRVELAVRSGVRIERAIPLRWTEPELAPQLR